MNCPKDNQPLKSRQWETGIEVDQCPSCGGVWLDHRELESIQSTVERDYSDQLARSPRLVSRAYEMAFDISTKKHLACPACDVEMEHREYVSTQIMIDVCGECRGVWLDRGELQALEVFFERVRKDEPPLEAPIWVKLSMLLRRK